MARFLVVVLAVLGARFCALAATPRSQNIAFSVGTLGFTWVLLAMVVAGIVAFKIKK